jgi:flagellar FliL protein
MAEPAAATEGEGAETAEGGGAPKKKLSGKKLIIIIVPILLLLGGGAAAYFLGFIGPKHEAKVEETEKVEPPPKTTIYAMPDVLVNLNTPPNARSAFVKLTSTVEIVEDDTTAFEEAMPRIIDIMITYLRELRPDDLRGSAGLTRLREELLSRIKIAAAPARVNDVLFREILVQ